MSKCNFCGREGLEWHENLGQLVDPITGKKHGFRECSPSKIPLYELAFGMSIKRSAWSIAHDITREAMKLGLNPFTVRVAYEGEFLIVKR